MPKHTLNKFNSMPYTRNTLWANGKVKRLCRRGRRVEPRGGHKHFKSSITQSRSTTWHPVIGSPLPPYCHLAADWTCRTTGWTSRTATLFANSDSVHATCRLLVVPYTCHVILSVSYGCHVSPCQWCHIIMFVYYGCHVSPCQWCHVIIFV